MAAEHHNRIVRRPEGPATMRMLLLLATIALLPIAASAGTIFTDSALSLTNYTVTTGLVNGSATIVPLNCPNCGPTNGPALEITGTFPNAPVSPSTVDTALAVLINNTFTYNPTTQGAITSLSASVDKNLSVNIVGNGFGNTFRPTILQDGVLYVAQISGPTLNCPPCTTGFNTIGGGLTAADFLQFDPATDTTGTATPNFAGDPMEFGLTQVFGAGAAEVIIADYADLTIAINAVPEPAALAVLGVGLLGLLAVRRRRIASPKH
jgi:hypothetical protein